MVRPALKTAALLLLHSSWLLMSCAAPPEVPGEGPLWRDHDDKPIAEPEFEEPSLIWTAYKRSGPDQLLELLDVDRNIRKLTGHPAQAKNTNSYDEIPNSSWFTNRHGYPATRLTPAEIERGLSLTDGPDTSGNWKVFRPKLGGVTPGFWIEDARGDQYLLKFDPPGNPEMATAAAAMGSRYFYACGYNVPQETIVYWNPETLRIRAGATVELSDGTRRDLTLNDIKAMLAKVHREADGTIRSLASLNLGNVKGPFSYDGVRKHDSNDWCPHQHRRELRALRVIGSLVNHYDLKDQNTMNVYVGESGRGYVMHYLIDFGSTFGSDGFAPKVPARGYSNLFDLRDVIVTTVTAGLKTWAWEDGGGYQYPSIGYFEAEIFEPEKFDPIIPNPAFEQLTNQDGYWGAKLVMAFDDDDLNSLVSAGKYSNPEAAAYLLETLKLRQGKIGRYWFSRVNPIDYPRITATDSSIDITFDDLWITAGLGKRSTHVYSIGHGGDKVIESRPANGDTVHLGKNDLLLMNKFVTDCGAGKNCDLFDIVVYSTRDGLQWKMPTKFSFRLRQNTEKSRIVAIVHPS